MTAGPTRRSAPLIAPVDAVAILIAAVLLRCYVFGNPAFQVDEQFYLLVGTRMWDGALPLVDIWDRKPPGLFLIYGAAAFFGNGIIAYQMMALACLVATAFIVYAMARRYADRPSALLSALGYVALPDMMEGMGGQSPIFYNLLMTGAAAIVMRVWADRAPLPAGALLRRGAAVMLLVGVAIQIKYTVIGEGIFFGLVLLWQAWRRHGPGLAVAGGALWVAVALLPTGLAIAYYAWAGQLDAFIFSNFLSIFHRGGEPAALVLDRLWDTLKIVLPPLIIGLLGYRKTRREGHRQERSEQGFVLGWSIAAWITYLLFGTYFPHYALPLVPPTMLLFACASGRWLLIRAMLVALAAILGLQAVILGATNLIRPSSLQHILATMAQSRNCPYVYRGPSAVYHLGDFCLPTHYAFPDHLNHTRERYALGIDPDAELRRILSRRPEFILLRWPQVDYVPENLAILHDALRRNYKLHLIEPQKGDLFLLYRLRPGVMPLPNDVHVGGKVGAQ